MSVLTPVQLRYGLGATPDPRKGILVFSLVWRLPMCVYSVCTCPLPLTCGLVFALMSSSLLGCLPPLTLSAVFPSDGASQGGLPGSLQLSGRDLLTPRWLVWLSWLPLRWRPLDSGSFTLGGGRSACVWGGPRRSPTMTKEVDVEGARSSGKKKIS
jgi:hypothetical protein